MGAAIVSPIPLARDEFSLKRHRTHFVFEHDPFGEPGARVSGSRSWKRSILQRFASQRKPAFGRDHHSGGRIFRTCTTRKLDDAGLALPALFRQQTPNASTRPPRDFQKFPLFTEV